MMKKVALEDFFSKAQIADLRRVVARPEPEALDERISLWELDTRLDICTGQMNAGGYLAVMVRTYFTLLRRDLALGVERARVEMTLPSPGDQRVILDALGAIAKLRALNEEKVALLDNLALSLVTNGRAS